MKSSLLIGAMVKPHFLQHMLGQTENIVLISDDLNHTKHSIYVYIQRIIALLKQKYPLIEVRLLPVTLLYCLKNICLFSLGIDALHVCFFKVIILYIGSGFNSLKNAWTLI